MPNNFPYIYEFPLPEVEGAPVPSNADYSPQNVAWLIEFLAGIIGKTKTEIGLRYENNTPSIKSDDIIVYHPNNGDYLPGAQTPTEQSPSMWRYEYYAKKSARLREFMETSPAGIEYFQ